MYYFGQHVRRAAVLALSTAAHNKPNLIKGLLPEILPLLYDQTVIKVCCIFLFLYFKSSNGNLLKYCENCFSLFFSNFFSFLLISPNFTCLKFEYKILEIWMTDWLVYI